MLSMPLELHSPQPPPDCASDVFPTTWSDVHTHQLLDLAHRSAQLALLGKPPLMPMLENYLGPLTRKQATFVRLMQGERVLIRVGTVVANCPLASDVCHNAYEAAARLAACPPADELRLEVHLVSPLHFVSGTTQAEFAARLTPGRDGVHVQCGLCNATFTPDKWGQWPAADDFFAALLQNARLHPEQCSQGMRVAIYQMTPLPAVTLRPPAPPRVNKPK